MPWVGVGLVCVDPCTVDIGLGQRQVLAGMSNQGKTLNITCNTEVQLVLSSHALLLNNSLTLSDLYVRLVLASDHLVDCCSV